MAPLRGQKMALISFSQNTIEPFTYFPSVVHGLIAGILEQLEPVSCRCPAPIQDIEDWYCAFGPFRGRLRLSTIRETFPLI
jgi:hypothetical protein